MLYTLMPLLGRDGGIVKIGKWTDALLSERALEPAGM